MLDMSSGKICPGLIVAQRHVDHKIKDSRSKRESNEDRPAIWPLSKSQAKGKGKENAKKQLRERRLHPLDHRRRMFIWKSMRIQA